jgi:hypothetical protein
MILVIRSLLGFIELLIIVMNAISGSFSETHHVKQFKICGSCRHVSFGLNKEEAEFLTEAIRRYNAGIFRKWLKMKVVKLPGRRGQVDPEKAWIISLINSHRVHCSRAKVDINLVGKPCFLWLPKTENEPIAELHTKSSLQQEPKNRKEPWGSFANPKLSPWACRVYFSAFSLEGYSAGGGRSKLAK